MEGGAEGEGEGAAGVGEAFVVDCDLVVADLEVREAEAARGVGLFVRFNGRWRSCEQ